MYNTYDYKWVFWSENVKLYSIASLEMYFLWAMVVLKLRWCDATAACYEDYAVWFASEILQCS